MPSYYGGNFPTAAALALGGDAHILYLGDSVTSELRSFTPAHRGRLLHVYPHLRWNYMVAPSYSTGDTNYSWGGSWSTATVNSYGVVRTETDYGGFGPLLIRPARKLSVMTINTDMSAGTTAGIQINRTFTASANAATGQFFPWPNANGSATAPRAWYHDSGAGDGYIKSKLVFAGTSTNQLNDFKIYTKRWIPTGSGGTSNATADLTVSYATPGENTYTSTGWTATLADNGLYNAVAGDYQNDHSLQLGIKTTTPVVGLVLCVCAGVFARTNSGGTIGTNARGASCGYDAIGRGGAYVTDWASNYATEADWTAYFTATVLNPTGVTVMFIEMGRNVLNTTEGTSGTVNSGWSTAYQSLITKLRAAYATAFPSGTLHLCLIMPPICLYADNGVYTVARCNAMQAAIEALVSVNANCSWMSHYLYFNKLPPMEQLHPQNPYDGTVIAMAERDMMDRATDFRYSTQGRIASGGARGRSLR